MTDFQPLFNVVVIKEDPKAEIIKAGLILSTDPEPEYNMPTGVIVACGPGTYQQGTFVPTVVKVGDHVKFDRAGLFNKIKIDGVETKVFMTRDTNVLGIIQD